MLSVIKNVILRKIALDRQSRFYVKANVFVFKTFLDIMNGLYKSKKDNKLEMRPAEKNSREGLIKFWNLICAPILFLLITYIPIWSNSDLFYNDEETFISEIRESNFGKRGLLAIRDFETNNKSPSEKNAQEEFD